MDYIIKFDNREKELIKLLEKNGYSLELENLDIGDIQFVDMSSKEIIIIIERKTLSDLSSSIKDGRYKEQKDRLIHSIQKNVRKIVLIEGTNISNFALPEKTLHSVIVNTMIRDNIHIHLTKNIEGTIQFIENIILQLSKYYNDLKDEIINNVIKTSSNEFSIQKIKKDNLTPEICFRNMIAQINGVSTGMATVFMNKYKNMDNFINKLKEEGENDRNKMIKILGDEKYGTRRIGSKVGERLYINIFGDCENDNIKEKNIKEKNIEEKNIEKKSIKIEKTEKKPNIYLFSD